MHTFRLLLSVHTCLYMFIAQEKVCTDVNIVHQLSCKIMFDIDHLLKVANKGTIVLADGFLAQPAGITLFCCCMWCCFLQPLDNIGETEKLKSSQIYT